MKYYIEETLPTRFREYNIVDVETIEEAQEIALKWASCYPAHIEIGTDYDHLGLKFPMCHLASDGETWVMHKA